MLIEKIYTPEMVAEHLHVSVITLKKWLRAGKLKGIKTGRQWRVRETDLQDFINQGDYSCHEQ